MIYFKKRFTALLTLTCCATLLVSCFKKTAEEIPARLQDDKVIASLDKEIAQLTIDKDKMQKRLDNGRISIEENALRPKVVGFIRKEYFGYEKLDRQIDQQLSYYKIKKSIRERAVNNRLGKLTLKDLEKEFTEYEISLAANKPFFPWRKLPEPEKPGDKKEDSEHATSDDQKKSSEKTKAAPGGAHH